MDAVDIPPRLVLCFGVDKSSDSIARQVEVCDILIPGMNGDEALQDVSPIHQVLTQWFKFHVFVQHLDIWSVHFHSMEDALTTK